MGYAREGDGYDYYHNSDFEKRAVAGASLLRAFRILASNARWSMSESENEWAGNNPEDLLSIHHAGLIEESSGD